jgi:hypothetical protein
MLRDIRMWADKRDASSVIPVEIGLLLDAILIAKLQYGFYEWAFAEDTSKYKYQKS